MKQTHASLSLAFSDVHCTVGRFATPPRHGPRTLDELLQAMDHAGVQRALVCHSQSIEAHPAAGNARLLEEIRGIPRLRPCWVLLPPTTDEMAAPEDLIQAMREAGVRAVRLCPSGSRHQFPLRSADARRLLAVLNEHRIPTLLDSAEASWDDLAAIGQACPNLPVVLLNVGYRAIRTAYPLLEAMGNLHIEISLYQGCGALREGVERFGAGRFLFGTGLPRFEPGCAVASVLYADITPDDKRRIAGGNLEALLEAAAP